MLGDAVRVILDGGPTPGCGAVDDRRLHRAARGGSCGVGASRSSGSTRSSPRPAPRSPTTEAAEHRSRRRLRRARVPRASSWSPLAVTYLLAVLAREVALRFGAIARGARPRRARRARCPTSAASRCSAGIVAAYLVARELPFLSTAASQVFHDAGIVVAGGGHGVRPGGRRRPDRARRPDEVRRPAAGAGFLVLNGVQFYYVGLPGGTVLTLEPPRRCCSRSCVVVATINAVNFVDGLDGLAAGSHRARGRGLLPLLLRRGGAQQGGPRDHRRAAVRGPGRCLRRLPAAQRQPGPDLHGRQRLDAASAWCWPPRRSA